MKKTILSMVFATTVALVSCKKDDDGATPSNQITYDGDSDNIIVSTVLQAGGSFGVRDYFPSDSTDNKHLLAAVSVASAKYNIGFQIGSSDTSKIATGVYNVTFIDERDANITSGNVVLLGAFVQASNPTENIEDFVVTEGSLTINSIDDDNINLSFDFVLANEKAVTGGYSGEYIDDTGM